MGQYAEMLRLDEWCDLSFFNNWQSTSLDICSSITMHHQTHQTVLRAQLIMLSSIYIIFGVRVGVLLLNHVTRTRPSFSETATSWYLLKNKVCVDYSKDLLRFHKKIYERLLQSDWKDSIRMKIYLSTILLCVNNTENQLINVYQSR